MMKVVSCALCLGLVAATAGCGQKGPLFLPGDSAAPAKGNSAPAETHRDANTAQQTYSAPPARPAPDDTGGPKTSDDKPVPAQPSPPLGTP